MRQPLWIINSSLFFLFLAATIFVILSQQKLPRWISIIPTAYTKTIKREISKTEIAAIYENDLFNTYQRPLPPLQPQQLEEQLPQPPLPQPVFLPQPTSPSFLEPLQASLHGIIIMGDSSKDRVMVENKSTRQEFTLKVGDVFEDAQLIQIFKNRAIFIRSNGQEEILYLREQDAKLAPEAIDKSRWEHVIKSAGTNTFIIDPAAFIEQVPTVANFIQDLDLLTIYKKGRPFGLRIGKMEAGSFGHELDLQPGDVILRVNGIPTSTQANRMALYKKVIEPPLKKNISITLLRNATQEITLLIKLQSLDVPTVVTLNGSPTKTYRPSKTAAEIEREKELVMRKKYTFAPTVEAIKQREKRSILKKIEAHEKEQKIKQRSVRLDI